MIPNTWEKDTLDRLYNKEHKTLQEIGALYGVCRERIRQVMSKFNLECGYNKSPNFRSQIDRRTIKTFDEYLALSKRRNGDSASTLRRFFPKVKCSYCGRGHHYLHHHHLNYPVKSREDIVILCPSCHFIEHRKGMTLNIQLKIDEAYNNGQSAQELANLYDVSMSLIYKILAKIRLNSPILIRSKHIQTIQGTY